MKSQLLETIHQLSELIEHIPKEIAFGDDAVSVRLPKLKIAPEAFLRRVEQLAAAVRKIVLELSFVDFAIAVVELSFPEAKVLVELADVAVADSLQQLAGSLFLVGDNLAFVNRAVGVKVLALAVLFVVGERTVKPIAVAVDFLAQSLSAVFREVSSVRAAILELINPVSSEAAVFEQSAEPVAVAKLDDTCSVRQIIQDLSLKNRPISKNNGVNIIRLLSDFLRIVDKKAKGPTFHQWIELALVLILVEI